MRVLFLLARIVLAGIFLYAGLIKATASAHFAVTLIPFTIIPDSWINPIALGLPIVEILAGVLLLIPRTKLYGAGLILLLCAGFIGILGWALATGNIVACGCFGQDETPSARLMAVSMGRDVLMALVAAAIVWDSLRKPRKAQTHKI